MSAPHHCKLCGLWHRGTLCALGGVTSFKHSVTHAPPNDVTHAVVYSEMHFDVRAANAGASMSVTAIGGPMTAAERRAKWRKANPNKHAEQQRRHRAKS